MKGMKWDIDCTCDAICILGTHSDKITIEVMQKAENIALARAVIDHYAPCITSVDVLQAITKE